MDNKSWTDFVKPAGSVLPNWHIILGVVFSLIAAVGLILTSEEPIVPVFSDPFDLDIEVEDPDALTGDGIDRVTRSIEADADQRARDLIAARQRGEQEALRQQRQERVEAQSRERAYREALESLQALRNRPNQPLVDRELPDRLAETADEAAMIQALRLEEIQRQANALRAPMVASSARGIGQTSHALDRPEITASYDAAQTVAAPIQFPGGLQRPGAVRPTAPGLSPPLRPGAGGARTGQPAAPIGFGGAPSLGAPGPQSSMAPVIQGPGAPPALIDETPSPDAPTPGRFQLGPRADGGDIGAAAGVVVTPVDGAGNYRLYEGKLIPSVLQTQIDGTYSGPISAQVTRHVYSSDRQRILIPRGTVALGRSGSVTDAFQGRLAVTFHRLIFPDGRWVRLNFAGLNSIGETSLRDQVNNHYLMTFGTAGAIGVLAGLSSGGGGDGQFRSAMSEQMAAISLTMLQRFLNRVPEVTIRAGHRVNIYLTSDLVFPDYATWQAG